MIGETLAFRGAPMAAGARLVKMSVVSETVEAPRDGTRATLEWISIAER